jgi:hypothetical protein
VGLGWCVVGEYFESMLSRKKRWAKRRGRIGGRSRLAPSRFVTPHATARSTEVPARKSLYTLSEALHGVVSVIVPKMDSCKTAVSARETQGGLGLIRHCWLGVKTYRKQDTPGAT